MRIGGGGSQDVNLLQSDAAQFRNQDFVVDAELAFWGAAIQAAVAANFSGVQLFNPAASGVLALIDQIVISSTSTQEAFITSVSLELTTDIGTWDANKLGASGGLSHLRAEAQGLVPGDVAMRVHIIADIPVVLRFEYPVQIPAGNGLNVVSGIVNVPLVCSYIGREI